MESLTIVPHNEEISSDDDDYTPMIEPEEYYHVPRGVKPWSKLYRFKPEEDDKIMFRGTKIWQRLIFDNDEQYKDIEEEKYQEFIKYIKKKGIVESILTLNRYYIPSNSPKAEYY